MGLFFPTLYEEYFVQWPITLVAESAQAEDDTANAVAGLPIEQNVQAEEDLQVIEANTMASLRKSEERVRDLASTKWSRL